MEIERQPIFLFDLCVHIVRFLPKAYRKEISDGKSYRVVAPIRTMVKKSLNFVLKKKRAYNFYSYYQKKN
jgi:hypothetical protein